MSESEDDENCFTTVYNSQTQKEIALLFLIRLCYLCPERKRGRKVSRICRKTCCNEHGTEYNVSVICKTCQ